jgi:hypothetical protein
MEALQKEQTTPTRKRSSGPLVGVRSALERRASGRPGRPCGGGGREDRLSSVLPELICYRRGHSPVPRPNSGMRSLGGRTWTQAALQARALHRCPTLTGRPRLWSGASLPFGRLSWRPPRACRAARPRTTPMRTRNPPRGALLAFGAPGSVLRSLVRVEVLGRKPIEVLGRKPI